MGMKTLPRYHMCFVCGKDNQCGLQSKFETGGKKVFYSFTPKQHHVGYKDRVHGGVLSAALDECMGWAVFVATRKVFYTLELNVRFVKPVKPGIPLVAEAEFAGDQRLFYTARGRVVDQQGVIYARARGKYVAMPQHELKEVLDYLDKPLDL